MSTHYDCMCTCITTVTLLTLELYIMWIKGACSGYSPERLLVCSFAAVLNSMIYECKIHIVVVNRGIPRMVTWVKDQLLITYEH